MMKKNTIFAILIVKFICIIHRICCVWIKTMPSHSVPILMSSQGMMIPTIYADRRGNNTCPCTKKQQSSWMIIDDYHDINIISIHINN